MPLYTRRQLLVRAAPVLTLAALLPACVQPRGAGTPAPMAQPRFEGRDGCPASGYRPDPAPGDPYLGGGIAELAVFAFADRVRRAQIIVVGTVRDILPARWATADGQRPANPHRSTDVIIFTPVRVEIERLVKGSYALPDLYLAEPGGRIGRDCASYGGSGRFPEFAFGGRYLYLIGASTLTTTSPVPQEDRYRYFDADASYGISAANTVTIGPERDIMGGRADDPPRTLTVEEVVREIAALSGQPGATPTR